MRGSTKSRLFWCALPVALIAMLYLQAGCLNPVRTYHDRFDNVTVYTTSFNTLPTPMSGSDVGDRASIGLNPCRMDFPGGRIRYSLRLDYDAESWMFIEKGESLVLLVDGQRLGFVGPGSSEHRDTYATCRAAYVTESSVYPNVKPEIIKLIANAKRVEVLVRGKYPRERVFDTL